MGNTVADAIWRKSSYSGSNGGGCVEVADNLPGTSSPCATRRTRTGRTLTFSRDEWRAFTTSHQAR